MVDNKEFIKDLSRGDPIGFIVSTHLRIEESLRGFIYAAYKGKKILEKNLEREHLWSLAKTAISEGLSKEVELPLERINKIRHRFSHQLNTRLNQEEVTEIKSILSERIVGGLIHSLEKGTNRKNKFQELITEDQCILILISLRQFIEAERIQLLESKQERRDSSSNA
jgi:hypothetical protein